MVGSDARATLAAGAPVTDHRPRRVGLLDNPRSGGNRRRPGALTRVLAEHDRQRGLDRAVAAVDGDDVDPVAREVRERPRDVGG